MKKLLLLGLFLLFQTWVFAQESQKTILINAGTQNIWERDFGYSPLIYKGSSIGLSLGYTNVSEKKTDEVYLHYSKLPIQNPYNAEMAATHASIITYTFYTSEWLPEKFTLGWSNNNALSLRDYEDAQNFNPRFDFHTSFGPALRYQTFFGSQQQWKFTSQAHWQVIGFLFSASYVTSPPDPFLHEQSTFNAFLQSIRLFQPFQQQDLGVLSQIFYQLPSRNEIGIGYRFNYTALENAHRSQRSGGHYFFQLNFRL